jgi:hypothetical protein
VTPPIFPSGDRSCRSSFGTSSQRIPVVRTNQIAWRAARRPTLDLGPVGVGLSRPSERIRAHRPAPRMRRIRQGPAPRSRRAKRPRAEVNTPLAQTPKDPGSKSTRNAPAGRGEGVGIDEMETAAEAEAAIAGLDGRQYEGYHFSARPLKLWEELRMFPFGSRCWRWPATP